LRPRRFHRSKPLRHQAACSGRSRSAASRIHWDHGHRKDWRSNSILILKVT
jgi:hypothetical protein